MEASESKIAMCALDDKSFLKLWISKLSFSFRTNMAAPPPLPAGKESLKKAEITTMAKSKMKTVRPMFFLEVKELKTPHTLNTHSSTNKTHFSGTLFLDSRYRMAGWWWWWWCRAL